MTSNNLPDVKQLIAAEAQDDFVGVWEVLWEVRERLGVSSPADRELAMRLIRELLQEGIVLAGDIDEGTGKFTAWDLSPREASHRIEREWNSLPRDPFTGDIAWLTSPKTYLLVGAERLEDGELVHHDLPPNPSLQRTNPGRSPGLGR